MIGCCVARLALAALPLLAAGAFDERVLADLLAGEARGDVIELALPNNYVASGAAAAVDAFLAPRIDWSVEREPWAAGGSRECSRTAIAW